MAHRYWYRHYLVPVCVRSDDGGMARSTTRVPEDRLRRHRELGAFLKSRRARVTPEAAGLPPAPRRRTPGLRREEVAQLAGVGVTWYTWLEQGRPINPSAQVIDAVARTLRLDRHERGHVFTLAGVPDPSLPPDNEEISEPVRLALDQLDPFPARVINARWDVLAYNRAEAAMMGDYARHPPAERNVLWLLFTDPGWRKILQDWEEHAAHLIALFRAGMADHVTEPAWRDLVVRLKERSPEFTRMWARNEVTGAEPRIKRFDHPEAGTLRMRSASLWLSDRPGVRMVIHTPDDTETRESLAHLIA